MTTITTLNDVTPTTRVSVDLVTVLGEIDEAPEVMRILLELADADLSVEHVDTTVNGFPIVRFVGAAEQIETIMLEHYGFDSFTDASNAGVQLRIA